MTFREPNKFLKKKKNKIKSHRNPPIETSEPVSATLARRLGPHQYWGHNFEVLHCPSDFLMCYHTSYKMIEQNKKK